MAIQNKPDAKSQEAASKLNKFYRIKNGDNESVECYKAAREEISKLKIVDIKAASDKLTISLARPGLLIGKKAENLFALQKHFGMKIEIVESFHWDEILMEYPYDPVDYF